MKHILILISVIALFLPGCGSLARSAPRVADEALSISDDVMRFATSRGDDLAQTSKLYTDDLVRGIGYSEQTTSYWDDLLRASQATDDRFLVLLYQEERLNTLQSDFVRWLREVIGMDREQSLLYLQNVCFVAGYYTESQSPLPKSHAQEYIKRVAEYNGIPISSIQDFSDSAVDFVEWFIYGNPDYSPGDAAQLLFNGLCLYADVEGP
jgi:hypothetical protein